MTTKLSEDALVGRTAECAIAKCKKERPSSLLLPFFSYREDQEKDEYYCGCIGWD
jgi:hypothetical protein